MAVNGKQKGSNFELKIAKVFSEWWGAEFHRTPGSGGLHWQKDNRVSGDIVPPEGFDFPFNIECKKHEGWSIEQIMKGKGDFFEWWDQCTRDADEMHKTPLLLFSKNRSPVFHAMRLLDWHRMDALVDSIYPYLEIHVVDKKETVVIGLFDNLLSADPDALLEVLSQ